MSAQVLRQNELGKLSDADAQLAQLHENRFDTQRRRAELASRLLLAQLRQLTLTGSLLAAVDLPAQ